MRTIGGKVSRGSVFPGGKAGAGRRPLAGAAGKANSSSPTLRGRLCPSWAFRSLGPTGADKLAPLVGYAGPEGHRRPLCSTTSHGRGRRRRGRGRGRGRERGRVRGDNESGVVGRVDPKQCGPGWQPVERSRPFGSQPPWSPLPTHKARMGRQVGSGIRRSATHRCSSSCKNYRHQRLFSRI